MFHMQVRRGDVRVNSHPMYNQVGGRSLVDRMLFALPFEAHLLSPTYGKYQYCGPGTRFDERDAQGQEGVNYLDKQCKDHDYHYGNYSEGSMERYEADKRLIDVANKYANDPSQPWFDRNINAGLVKHFIGKQAERNKPQSVKDEEEKQKQSLIKFKKLVH